MHTGHERSRTTLSLRLKMILFAVLIIFVLNIIAFIFLENLPPLDAFYFLVVTVSTVGYGDITPENAITKILLILLIIASLTSIASFSELAVDNMIRSRMNPNFDLPETPLELQNHVIVGGFNQVAHRIAHYFTDRFYQVVILDESLNEVKNARAEGLLAYHADISRPYISDRISAASATAVYLFLEDDNKTMQASISMRKENSSIQIFALTKRHLSENFAQAMGITRSYTVGRVLGSFISVISLKMEFLKMPNQDTTDAEFIIHRVPVGIDFEKLETSYYILGKVNAKLNIFEPNYSQSKIKKEDFLIIAIPKEEVGSVYQDISPDFTGDIDTLELGYRHIIIGGFSPYISEAIKHLRVPQDHFVVVTFEESEAILAEEFGLKTYHVKDRDDLSAILEKYISSQDLFLSFFPNIQDSMYFNVVVDRMEEKPATFQVVLNDFEFDIFCTIGSAGIISPTVLLARSMFLIYLTTNNEKFSLIQTDSHGFEYKVKEEGPLDKKEFSDFEEMGIEVLLLKKHNSHKIIQNPKKFHLSEGDRVYLLVKRDFQ